MPKYKVKALVKIEIETDFETAPDDPDPPTPETIKFCIDEDINEGRDIAGAIGDCQVLYFASSIEPNEE